MGKQFDHSHLVSKAKTGVGKRAIARRMPQVMEPPKNLLALMGHKTSAVGKAVLNDIHILKKPLCKKLQRKNELLPFEAGSEAHMENLCRLNDCSLFALVNHNKKRPHNLIFGRTFQFRILDMVEFGIVDYMPMALFPKAAISAGSRPLVIFNGDAFDANPTLQTIESLLLDVFRGPDDGQELLLSGVDHVIVFSLSGNSKVLFRHYGITLHKDENSTLPKAALTEVGPRFDLEIRRVHVASEAMLKESMKRAKDPRVVKNKKNISHDLLGDKLGQVHVGRQDLTGLALARMKGLNKKRGAEGISKDVPDLNETQDATSNGKNSQPEEAAPSPKRAKVQQSS